MSVLYENRRRARKVRWILLFFALAVLLGFGVGAYVISHSESFVPAFPESMTLEQERWFWVAVCVFIAILMPALFAAYADLYVTRIERSASEILIDTLGATLNGRRRRHAIADLARIRQLHDNRPGRSATGMLLSVRGALLPFVIDDKAEVLRRQGLLALTKETADS